LSTLRVFFPKRWVGGLASGGIRNTIRGSGLGSSYRGERREKALATHRPAFATSFSFKPTYFDTTESTDTADKEMKFKLSLSDS